jgi:hypothetical protein
MSSPFQQQFSAKSPLNQGLISKDDKRPREVINAETKEAIKKGQEEGRLAPPGSTNMGRGTVKKYKPKPTNKATFTPSSELSDEEIKKMKEKI